MSLTLNYTKSEHQRLQKMCETIPLSEVKASRIWETAASNENTKIEETKFCSCFNLQSPLHSVALHLCEEEKLRLLYSNNQTKSSQHK